MNHQPFEDWLLDPQKLDPKQKLELQAHLQACPECSALAEVELTLRAIHMAEPDPGFTERFQVRLAEQKLLQQRRNAWGFSLLTLAVGGVLVWLIWPLIAAIVHAPINTLSSWLAALISLWTSVQIFGHLSELLFTTLPAFIPPYIWTALLLGSCGWTIIWFLSLKKFVKLPQGV